MHYLQTAPGNSTSATGANLGRAPEHQKRHKLFLRISFLVFWWLPQICTSCKCSIPGCCLECYALLTSWYMNAALASNSSGLPSSHNDDKGLQCINSLFGSYVKIEGSLDLTIHFDDNVYLHWFASLVNPLHSIVKYKSCRLFTKTCTSM